MALDGLVVRAITHELQALIGGRISKIHQPNDLDIVMQIRSGATNYKLLLSANATYPRVHFTNKQFINPLEAPMFCMLMRKHFESGTIQDIGQIGMERMLYLDIRQRDELGDLKLRRIIIELMGRHSNIIMIDPDTNNIIDSIRRVTPSISRYRVVLPGSQYVHPPDQGKTNPLQVSTGQLRSWIEAKLIDNEGTNDASNTESEQASNDASNTESAQASIDALDTDSARTSNDAHKTESAQASTDAHANGILSTRDVERWLVAQLEGISPFAAKEIVQQSGWSLTENSSQEERADMVERLCMTWAKWLLMLQHNEYSPTIITQASAGKSFFYIAPITHIEGKSQPYSSISACLEAYYSTKAEHDVVKQKAADLIRFLQNEWSKNTKKLDKLQETLEEAAHADKYRIRGELLTAYMHQIQKGDSEVKVINYYDEAQAELTITLDPLLTPSENAQRLFKRYTKSKNSVMIVNEQIQATHIELEYIESILQQLETANAQDIDEIREELAEGGYVRQRGKAAHKKKKSNKPQLTYYYSTEGIEICVGKNNTQNEYLTNRLAHASDTWLHTKDIPGSHVVIRSATFNEQTLEEAAMLAAFYSKARESSQVPVDYTLIRHVRKPNGAKPGDRKSVV